MKATLALLGLPFVLAFAPAQAADLQPAEAAFAAGRYDEALPLFQAALEATEEAVLNALLRATSVTGMGRTVEAIPIDRVREALRKHGRAPSPAASR